jgi:hypothetical protein
LYENEPVMDVHSKQIGRVEHIRSDASIQVRWLDGSVTLVRLDDLELAPGYKRRGHRRKS